MYLGIKYLVNNLIKRSIKKPIAILKNTQSKPYKTFFNERNILPGVFVSFSSCV